MDSNSARKELATPTAMAPGAASALLGRLAANIEPVLRGQRATVRKVLSTLAAGGHVLLEDVPGTGKTTLAKAMAASLDLQFNRIQFTPDLLPADILGMSVFEPGVPGERGAFRFHPGPVFTDVLLADEINRASPRTQSALLEAMGESQVSLETEQRPLSDAFFVLATQNPVEFEGTYPLPESQMDRFAVRLGLGYVSPAEEVAILSERTRGDPLDQMSAVARREDVIALRETASRVPVADELKHYIVALVSRTRSRDDVRVGASTRASLALFKLAQALALFDASEMVLPEHVRDAAVDVIAHRLMIEPEARYAGVTDIQVVQVVLDETPIPV